MTALTDALGEPDETERLHFGMSAVRIDTYPCGCVRTYRASVIPGDDNPPEELRAACDDHDHLAALAVG